MLSTIAILGATAIALASCQSNRSAEGKTTERDDATATRVVEFDEDSAYSYVENQVAMGPRVPGSEAHGRCVGFITKALERFGADSVIVQEGRAKVHTGETIPVKNILGRFNAAAPKRVLIAAHYDTRPWADQERDESKRSQPVPGANDGGSGVGVALELARQIGMKAPGIGVDFLFVDAEDSGLSGGWSSNEDTWCLGTQLWTQNMPYDDKTPRPVYGIVLDMVGGDRAVFTREHISERLAPEVNAKVWGTAARSEFASRFDNSVSGSLIDDHLFINRAGIPCIDIVECSNPATGSFPATWHTLGDDMHAIDRSTLKAVGQVVADVLYAEGAE